MKQIIPVFITVVLFLNGIGGLGGHGSGIKAKKEWVITYRLLNYTEFFDGFVDGGTLYVLGLTYDEYSLSSVILKIDLGTGKIADSSILRPISSYCELESMKLIDNKIYVTGECDSDGFFYCKGGNCTEYPVSGTFVIILDKNLNLLNIIPVDDSGGIYIVSSRDRIYYITVYWIIYNDIGSINQKGSKINIGNNSVRVPRFEDSFSYTIINYYNVYDYNINYLFTYKSKNSGILYPFDGQFVFISPSSIVLLNSSGYAIKTITIDEDLTSYPITMNDSIVFGSEKIVRDEETQSILLETGVYIVNPVTGSIKKIPLVNLSFDEGYFFVYSPFPVQTIYRNYILSATPFENPPNDSDIALYIIDTSTGDKYRIAGFGTEFYDIPEYIIVTGDRIILLGFSGTLGALIFGPEFRDGLIVSFKVAGSTEYKNPLGGVIDNRYRLIAVLSFVSIYTIYVVYRRGVNRQE